MRRINVTTEKKVVGVSIKASKYYSERVIYAAPVNGILKLVNNRYLSTDLITWANALEPTAGIEIHFYHKHLDISSFDNQFKASELKGSIMVLDEPLYIKFPTNLDRSWTPENVHMSSWLIMLPRKFSGEKKVIEEHINKIYSWAEYLFPNFKDTIINQRIIIANPMNAAMLKIDQSRKYRVDFVSDTIRGLYFVGDTTKGEGCSSDIAFSSAMKLFDILNQ